MCLSGGSKNSCSNYEENMAYVKSSNNMCWGMGASNYIPCKNCGVEFIYHRKDHEAEE